MCAPCATPRFLPNLKNPLRAKTTKVCEAQLGVEILSDVVVELVQPVGGQCLVKEGQNSAMPTVPSQTTRYTSTVRKLNIITLASVRAKWNIPQMCMHSG